MEQEKLHETQLNIRPKLLKTQVGQCIPDRSQMKIPLRLAREASSGTKPFAPLSVVISRAEQR